MTIETSSGFILLGTCIGLHTLCILALLWFHCRRSYQPIRSRLYWQSETIGILFLITNAISVCSNEFEVEISCISFAATNVFFYSTLSVILLRASHVYSAYAVSKLAVSKEIKTSKEDHLYKSRFVKYAHVFQSFRFQVYAYVTVVAALCLIWAVGSVTATDAGCTGLSPVVIAMLVVSFLCVVFVVLVGWNIATLKDGLYIRLELFLVALIGSSASVIQTITLVYFHSVYYTNLTNVIGFYLGFGVFIGLPLFKSYKMASNMKIGAKMSFDTHNATLNNYILKNPDDVIDAVVYHNETDAGKLRNVLNQEGSYEDFLEFCRLELNHENALFYQEVVKVSSQIEEDPEYLDTEEFERRARHVYAKYIESASAPLQVNVPSKVLDQFDKAGFDTPLLQLDNHAAYTALRMALAEVFHLMLYDIFPRFKKTSKYQPIATVEEV